MSLFPSLTILGDYDATFLPRIRSRAATERRGLHTRDARVTTTLSLSLSLLLPFIHFSFLLLLLLLLLLFFLFPSDDDSHSCSYPLLRLPPLSAFQRSSVRLKEIESNGGERLLNDSLALSLPLFLSR